MIFIDMCIYTFTCLSVCVCIYVKTHAYCGTRIELRGQLVRVCSYFLPCFQEGPLLFLPLFCVPAPWFCLPSHHRNAEITNDTTTFNFMWVPGDNLRWWACTASVFVHQAISLASRRLAVWRETLFTYFHRTCGRIVLTDVSVAIQYLLGSCFYWSGAHT